MVAILSQPQSVKIKALTLQLHVLVGNELSMAVK